MNVRRGSKMLEDEDGTLEKRTNAKVNFLKKKKILRTALQRGR